MGRFSHVHYNEICFNLSYLVSSGGSGATIVGESTVPKKPSTGVVATIATQAGTSKIMHPEEDLSLVIKFLSSDSSCDFVLILFRFQYCRTFNLFLQN